MTSNRLCLLVSVWIVATANHSFWTLLLRDQAGIGKGSVFVVSVALALVGLHLFLLRVLSPGRSVRWVASLMLILAATASWFMDTYGIAIDSGMVQNVVQTDISEAGNFIGWSLLWRLTWQAALPIVLVWRARLPAVSWAGLAREYAVGSAVGLALLFAPGLPMYSHYASFFRNQDTARYLISPANVVVASLNLFRKTQKGRQPYVVVGSDARRREQFGTKPLVVVMVVGETARAANFSLGGYARDTNPLLARKKVFYFRDVSSCGTATAVSVPCMFSDLPRAEFELSKASRRDTVLDVLKRAGVAVTWIDNQSGCKSVCARIPSRSAEVDHPASCSAGECLDDALLHSLPIEMRTLTSDTLIVLHAMGSHGPTYFRRVPPDHEVFKPICPTERIETCSDEQIVNSYDNSIAYTDFVLSGLIDQLDAEQNDIDSVLLYVSDHGESLGEKGLYLHGQPYLIAPDVQKKVPMMLWFSSGTISRLGLDTTCVAARLAAPASHDNVSHTLLGLANVATSIYRPGLDLLRECRSGPDGDRIES
ncbi:MAG: phosphoethanolamine--lipid A transferase [Pseudomonadota bacterium]